MQPTLEDRFEAMRMQVDVTDWVKWKVQHVTLFGHVPRTNTDTKEYCTHPLHGIASQDMVVGNVAARGEHFHPKTVLTQDDMEIDPAWLDKEPEDPEEQVRVFDDAE